MGSTPDIEIDHYLGIAGADYFNYQSRFGALLGSFIANKFASLVTKSDVVLDFGCGGGFVLKALECRARLGVDINPVARLTAADNGVTCFERLAEVNDGTVDVAIAHHSLEHVASPLLVLRELRLKLKPNGRLLIVVPIDDWRTQRDYHAGDVNHHLYTWTPLLLGHLLKEAGFDLDTFSSRLGVNGWFRAFPYCYGKLPTSLLSLALRIWCALKKTREIQATVRNYSGMSTARDVNL